jgi:hypothetical protein
MIHYQRLGCAPKQDYRPPRPGRLKLSWNLHPKAMQSSVLQASDLTPCMPPVGNQDQIGACNSYGTKDGAATSLAKAGKPLPGYLAALPLYRGVRCLERAQSTSSALPPLTDCGAGPDDVLTFAQHFGIQTSQQECGEAGPSDKLSQYEDAHVNDEPTLGEFEHDSSFRLVGGFDITSTGDQRLLDVSNALAAGYAVGISVYAADARYQGYNVGVLPDPPAGAGNDHWNYLVGLDLTTGPLFAGVNSWTSGWGRAWGSAPGGLWLGGPGIIQAADALIAYAVSEV